MHTRFQYASSNENSLHSYNAAGKQTLVTGKSSHQENILGSGLSQVPHARIVENVKKRVQSLIEKITSNRCNFLVALLDIHWWTRKLSCRTETKCNSNNSFENISEKLHISTFLFSHKTHYFHKLDVLYLYKLYMQYCLKCWKC